MVTSGALKVLVIEDEAVIAMMIEDILLELGHDIVAIAGRMDSALNMAAKSSFDLAVLDLNLNGERTDAVAAALRARGIPFVFATGYGAAGVPADCDSVPVVQKPFQPRELALAINEAVRH